MCINCRYLTRGGGGGYAGKGMSKRSKHDVASEEDEEEE